MVICVDIGNTLTDIGFFNEEKKLFKVLNYRSERIISEEEIFSSFSLFLASNRIEIESLEGVIISSVVPSLEAIYSRMFKNKFNVECMVIGKGIKLGLPINTDYPKEVGADLIMDAVGAKAKYGNKCIIVDMGTANKVILLDDKGAFAGCVIAPGVNISSHALFDKTAALHEISLEIPKKVLGKNTKDSLNSAFTFGTAFSLTNLALAIEKEAGYECKKILTGGLSSLFVPLFEGYEYEKNLILEGLYATYLRNRS
ncbi:MAG: type III pantothenate kinase [Bacilli bacterium]|nr:type III pantothenate kinase [Bacilli bacterium]MDY6430889.1 type III pantothenate kinase [Bacilli bacterium]